MTYQGAADTELRLGIDTDFLRQSIDRAQTVFDRFNTQSIRRMGRTADRMGAQNSMMGQMWYPSNAARTPQAKMSSMNRQMRMQTQQMGRVMSQSMKQVERQAKALEQKSPFASWAEDAKKFEQQAKAIQQKKLDQSIFGGSQQGPRGIGSGGGGRYGIGSPGGGGFGRFMGRAGGMAGGAARWGAKNTIKAGMFGGGAVLGFMVSAFREAISKYEQVGRSRLQASSTLGSGARFAGGGAMGYNAAEAAQIQAQGARAGIGGGRLGGRYSMQLMRAVGAEGVQFGGGIMSRQNLRGAGGARSMMKQMSQAFSVAVETGLERARVPEFLQAANQLAEQQIQITPGKDQFKSFVKELGILQEGGLRGRHGSAALGRAHQAIQGATGVRQAFLMRAFGFGKGANLIDVLKRQELGAGGGNMMAIMKQLQKEYGAGKDGGLSSSAKYAFKGMNLGSIHMAEKFSDIYLQRKSGKLTHEQAEEKIKGIMDKEQKRVALQKMPSIQVEAYKNMANFGGVVKLLSSRFDRMAKMGAKWFPMLKTMDNIQKAMVKNIEPTMQSLGKAMPSIGRAMTLLAGPIASGIASLVTNTSKLVQGIGAFGKGYASGGLVGAFRALGNVYDSGGNNYNISLAQTGGGVRLTKASARAILKRNKGNLKKASAELRSMFTSQWDAGHISTGSTFGDAVGSVYEKFGGRMTIFEQYLSQILSVLKTVHRTEVNIKDQTGSQVTARKKKLQEQQHKARDGKSPSKGK